MFFDYANYKPALPIAYCIFCNYIVNYLFLLILYSIVLDLHINVKIILQAFGLYILGLMLKIGALNLSKLHSYFLYYHLNLGILFEIP